MIALLSSGVAILFQFALFLTGRRDAVGVLSRAFRNFRKAGQNLSHIHRQPDAARNLWVADCRDSGRGNVELKRRAECAFVEFHHGLLRALRPQADERTKCACRALSTFVWALLLFALAVLSLHKVGRVIEVGLQIASVAYGALLGVFLLGVLTKRANQSGAMIGMLFGFTVELYIWLERCWTWNVAIRNMVR